MSEFLEGLLSTLSPNSVTSFVIFTIIIIFFTSWSLAKNNKAHEFVQYTPTLLTTLGIFGTFVGIVLGLLDFDHTQIDSSIELLLAGLKTAFITSLAGMLSSLLFKTLLTTPILKPKASIEEVNSASPELILAAIKNQATQTEMLKDAIVGNDETTLFGQLKILRGDINDNAKTSINLSKEQFELQNKQMLEFTEKLWLKLQDFADTLSKSATEQVIEALKQVIVDFNNNLTEQFGENFKRLNEAVLKLVEWQENYKHQLEQMNEQYAQGVKAIESTESSVASISEKTQVIPETMNTLNDIMTISQHQLEDLKRHLEVFKDMRDKAVEAVPEIREQVQKTVDDVSKAVFVASEHYQSLLSESDNYINKHISTSEDLLTKFVTETEKGISTVGGKLIESTEAIGKTIEVAGTEFTNNTARTNESLQTSSDHLQSQAEVIKHHLTDTASDLSRTMTAMIDEVVKDSKSINDTLKTANTELVNDTKIVRDNFIQSNEQMQQQVSSMLNDVANQQVKQAQRTFDALEDEIRSKVALAGDAVNSQLETTEKAIQSEVNRVMGEMGKGLGQISGQFTNDYLLLTKQMQKVVNENVSA